MKTLFVLFFVVAVTVGASATEYHVSLQGNDKNAGTVSKPYRTISAAAQIAQPGDCITVHGGTYRERITPPRGGDSDTKRIVYRAVEGEKVEVKGSEVITEWKKFGKGVWKVTIANSFFGSYNPYKNIIVGDWFSDHGRIHHTGEVFLRGKSLYEVVSLQDVLNPKPYRGTTDQKGSTYTWYCESDKDNTVIYANFHEQDPNKELVEINVRNSCFYPAVPGVNYITIRGFHMSQAATQWAPPTAEQIGLIGTHWSKGWIIENNVISNSKCVGITLGKDRKSGQNVWLHNRNKGGATHYNEVIFRALRGGWSKEKIGSHLVRNNNISNCEQAGIVGSLGAVFSTITDNHIHDIWTKRLFSGAEIGGIKIHAAIDVLIKHNHIHNTGRGIWLDWMAQGTRVTGNLLYNNSTDDLFTEVNHGPFLVDNNLFLSQKSLQNWSEGAAFVHNLIAGQVEAFEEVNRYTPYHFAHSTQVAGLRNLHAGHNRFYNNIFVQAYPNVKQTKASRGGHYRISNYGLQAYDRTTYQMLLEGNLYLHGAKPYKKETKHQVQAEFDPKIKIEKEGSHVYLSITLDDSLKTLDTPLITTKFLGRTKISELGFEAPDGSPLKIDTDYFGKPRNQKNPTAGPFENPGRGTLKLKVW